MTRGSSASKKPESESQSQLLLCRLVKDKYISIKHCFCKAAYNGKKNLRWESFF